MSERFQDRLSDFPLPAKTTGERPRIYAAARGTGGRILTRRSLVGLLAAGTAGVFPRAARGAACSGACSTGAFAHEILLASLSFSPDGKTLITAGQDLFVKFWTVPNGALFRTISAVDVPYRLAVSPDGNWIAVGMAHTVISNCGRPMARASGRWRGTRIRSARWRSRRTARRWCRRAWTTPRRYGP